MGDVHVAEDAPGGEPSTIAELLVARAGAQPDSIAIVDDAGASTWAELLETAALGAAALVDLGLAPGDRLGIQLPNGLEWVVTYWAGALAGLVAVPVDVRNRPAEVAAMMARSGASALVAAPGAEHPDHIGETRVLRRLDLGESSPSPEEIAALPGLAGAVAPGDVHFLQFTSGSTGLPKAAMLTHRGLLVNCRALASAWGLRRGEPLLVPSPLSHVLGFLTGCLVPATVGATGLTMAAFDPERALALIDRFGAVGMSGTPTHYLMLVEHPERPRYDCSSLRFAMYGGAPMTPDAAARITESLGVSWLLGSFGMSETSGGVTSVVPGDPLDVQLATIGRPLPTFAVRVVDAASGAEVAAGEVGELWVRGEPVCLGYWADPEETARSITPDGWLRTGDLVSQRPDGNLVFEGRLKEIILIGGYTVHPGEIERVLAAHPAVAEAVVVAAPGGRLGEIPVAFVRLFPGTAVTGAELESYCRAELASYKVPRHYAFRDALPVSATGKVERFALRQEAAALVAAASEQPA